MPPRGSEADCECTVAGPRWQPGGLFTTVIGRDFFDLGACFVINPGLQSQVGLWGQIAF